MSSTRGRGYRSACPTGVYGSGTPHSQTGLRKGEPLIKSYATFRRHPYGQVVPPTHDDLQIWEVVPYGKLGGGVWNGNMAGLIAVIGILIVGLVGLPEWRYFFGATVLAGSIVAYTLLKRHRQL